MMGAEDALDLPAVELSRVKKVINQAYRECYTPVDGFRPDWAVEMAQVTYLGEVSIEATLTEGSSEFTYTGGEALTADHSGSIVFGLDSPTMLASIDPLTLTGTIVGTSGVTDTVTLTINVNSHRIPAHFVDIDGMPERLGYGLLSPMMGYMDEVRYRSLMSTDFAPKGRFGISKSPRYLPSGDEYDFGDPIFYYVDSTGFPAQEDIRLRLVVYPLPKSEVVVNLRANVIPPSLTEDDAVPQLPANVVDDVLLPIARCKLAMIDPRYNSQNVKFLVTDMEEARKRLRSLSSSQKHRQRTIRLRSGY
jgi:hypothetical protein